MVPILYKNEYEYGNSLTTNRVLKVFSNIHLLLGSKTITLGKKREKPNLVNKRTCSMIKIAASPGSIFHFPSSSYSHAKIAQLVHIDISIRNYKMKNVLKLELYTNQVYNSWCRYLPYSWLFGEHVFQFIINMKWIIKNN